MKQITLFITILSVVPFFLLQNSSNNSINVIDSSPLSSFTCSWYGNKCNLFSFHYLFYEAYNMDIATNPNLNNFKGQLLSYGTYLLFGNGRVIDKDYFIVGTLYENQGSKINFIYLIFTFFVIVSFFNRRYNLKILLLMFFIIYLIAYSMYYDRIPISLNGIEAIFIIPLASLGLFIITNKISNKKIIRSLLVIFILIILISPIFSERIIQKSFKTSIFNEKNNLDGWETWWSAKECGIPYKIYSYICKKVFMMVKNERIP